MDFKNINIDMDGMHRDDNRGIFVYTPAVGMEVKIVISSLCKISKSINGHTIETDINDVIIRIDKKSDEEEEKSKKLTRWKILAKFLKNRESLLK